MGILLVKKGNHSRWKLRSAERKREIERSEKRLKAKELMLFKLWCWRRLLRVPLTARRSNQSILKEISPEYSLEGLILKLKLQ